MEDERCLHQLNGVAHVAGTINEENMPLHDRIIPYLERTGLYHLARLNAHWFWLDEPLVSAFIERWWPETHTFHMLFGECTITLQDVAYQLGLPVDGQPISGCMTDFHLHIEGAKPIVWEPYGSLDVLIVIHPEIPTEEHSRLWWAVTSLIYFAVIEWHQDGRGGDIWFPSYYRTWHEHSDERVHSVLSIQRVAEPGPSVEFLDWWYRVAHRILSPGIAFVDPRPVEIPKDAVLRGSS
ncbi:uncharacterized protein DS421_15g502090 [Arachis hypogaea]|nr:uncharacterized protein DS421_15g502090 [Arachis hypogaea]